MTAGGTYSESKCVACELLAGDSPESHITGGL